MIALATTLLLCLAALGAGAVVLAACRCDNRIPSAEYPLWAFTLGLGVVGWLIFFAGIMGQLGNTTLIIVLLGLGCGNAVWLRRVSMPSLPTTSIQHAWLNGALIAVIGIVMIGDVLEALAPAADGDTLAYHFAQPQAYLNAGQIFFIPRAVDATSPMLVNMTYLPAMALGDERAANLWLMISGWAVAGLAFVISRRWMSISWALCVALLVLTTPAIVYAAGTGQVEVRLALFATVGLMAISAARSTGFLGFAVIAGLAVGFYAASKYTGLLFAAAGGLVLIWGAGGLRRAVYFSFAVVAAGFQWYLWNALHTGDPFFPMLFDLIGVSDPTIWNSTQNQYFRAEFFGSELGVDRNLFWFFAYPFKATVDGLSVFESSRTGLGPFVLLILPIVGLAVWRRDPSITSHSMASAVFCVLIFYALWFFTGSSQRIRHLVPFYPVVLILMTGVAVHWYGKRPVGGPLLFAVAVSIGLQFGGQALASVKFARFVFSDMSREAYLEKNVSNFTPIPWLNDNLSPSDRVAHNVRAFNYLLRVPGFLALPSLQAKLNTRPDAQDLDTFLKELRSLGITHLFVHGDITNASPIAFRRQFSKGRPSAYWMLVHRLVNGQCAEVVKSFPVKSIISRTLPIQNQGAAADVVQLVRLRPSSC